MRMAAADSLGCVSCAGSMLLIYSRPSGFLRSADTGHRVSGELIWNAVCLSLRHLSRRSEMFLILVRRPLVALQTDRACNLAQTMSPQVSGPVSD